jgi:two-component system, LuxR family, sensor kinase FixL
MQEAPPGRLESPRHRNDSQFCHLLEVMPAAAYTCDADGLITAFNRRAVELWGRAPQVGDPVDRY